MERELIISSKIENLRLVEKLVDDISAASKLSAELYGNLLIACIEAVNNAITHGNKLNADKDVTIKVSIEKKNIIVKVIDQGNGFDFSNVPDATAPENIENITGRGVFLMKQLSDKLEFKEGGRISVLTFNLK